MNKLEDINDRTLKLERHSRMPKEVLTVRGWESVVSVYAKDMDWLNQQAGRVQELEKEFELYDITIHKIGMVVNNPGTSADEKWDEVNRLITELNCIHCNGKGFNGLDYCSQCPQGKNRNEYANTVC